MHSRSKSEDIKKLVKGLMIESYLEDREISQQMVMCIESRSQILVLVGIRQNNWF